MTVLAFESDRFRPYLPDDCQVNPNVLGFELADWLSRELARRGWVTSYPNYEDWGWFLDGAENGSEYMICCSGRREEAGRFEWRVYVMRPKTLFGRKPDPALEQQFLGRIRAIVEESGIRTRLVSE